MFENKKHVFWQAFFLTLLFFFLGLVLGVYLEQSRADSINVEFHESEAFLYDAFALGNLPSDSSISCEDLSESSRVFADRIYEEARNLEQFDDSNKLTDSLKAIHKKYDLLRTILWMNVLSIKEDCEDINTVVYLYVYDTNDIQTRSEQAVWSKILEDLKQESGADIILIPIAIDQGVVSLEYLIKRYELEKFPAVIINEEHIFYEHVTSKELSTYLD